MYRKVAARYKPDKIRLLFIAESPPHPKDGEAPRYFYFEDITRGDILLRSIMEVVAPEEYAQYKDDKPYLLKLFKDKGCFLIDACDYPIDQYANRDRYIIQEREGLIERVKTLICPETRIVLIKKNVFRLLYPMLIENGFDVINRDYLVFPAFGNQGKFKQNLKKLLGWMV